MKVKISILMLCCSILFLMISCCPISPTIDTVITAHGNTDWHIDTAEEFLYGTDMGGGTTAANHVPNSWNRRHMHVGLTNTNHFYYDADLTTPGDDTDNTSGIDQAMLFFYAGHGNPTIWNTLGNNGTQSNMRLGDCPGGGLLRYYWQCSCEVFAHGPRTCAGATFHYACPGGFDGSADSYNMRNIYERWGPALDPDLRMAGGASTSAYCHESQTNKIWNNYNNNLFDVADSFIDGLNWWGVVPLCITLGGSDVTLTPLYDATFTNLPNTSGTSHYHIQYLSSFASQPSTSGISSVSPHITARFPIDSLQVVDSIPIGSLPIPEKLPIYKLKKMPRPESLKNVRFQEMKDWLVSTDEIKDRGPRVRINKFSGAVYMVGDRHKRVDRPYLKEDGYLEKANGFIKDQGWTDRNFKKPTVNRFVFESVPVYGKYEERKESQKNVLITFKRQIPVDDVIVDILGEGGIIKLQLNNDGSVFNATKVWRGIDRIKELAPVKPYEKAYEEALEGIKYPEAYKLDQWKWGYKEAAGNVEQNELKIVYQFAFVPINEEYLIEYPPKFVEIQGQ